MKFKVGLKALSPISHFGDEQGSNVRRFRRHRVALREPVSYPTRFQSHADRRTAIVRVLHHLYTLIPSERKTLRIWEEFTSKIDACANEGTKEAFVSRFMQLFNCGVIRDTAIINLLESFNDFEFLQTIRDEKDLIVSKVYGAKEFFKTTDASETPTATLFGQVKVAEQPAMTAAAMLKTFERVPVLSGNSIRGTLRDIAGRHWCELTSIGKERPALNVTAFHQIFTGGSITESGDFEDLEIQRNYARLIPPVGLFGTAIGAGTLQGQLVVGPAILKCKENGTGDVSMWGLVQQQMFTRTDTLADADYDLWQHDGPLDEIPSQQMIWHQEDIIQGAEFDLVIAIRAGCSDLLYNCFCALMLEWQSHPYLGGQSARGFGHVQIDVQGIDDIKERAEAYTEHVRAHANEASEFVSRIGAKKKGKK